MSQWPNDGERDPDHDPQQARSNARNPAPFPNDVIKLNILDPLAVALARAGFAEDALRLYKANRAMGVKPTWGLRVPRLSEIAEALARAGKFPEALQVAAQIPDDSIERLNAAYEIALEQVGANDFAGALRTISNSAGIPKKSGVERDLDGKIKSVTLRGKSIARANILRAIALAQMDKGNRKAALATLGQLRQLNDENADGAEPETLDLLGLGLNGISPMGESRQKLTPRVAQVELEAVLDEFPAARKTAGNLTSPIEKAQAFLFLGKTLLAAGRSPKRGRR